ncbi:hypothetical protein BIX54_00505 [Mycoplasmoides pneumoniae]|nr:hypothetical protein [Mycoplasmoides pneumoniae]AJR19008.1 hypothetical protein C985_00775 [Mycoplasmoides pneumoniae M129-B7]ALA29970.1 hypothetical protein C897_00505 [Mycoplasmoides pneumoniae PI 1428]ALA30938.1 hypothetical protein B434_02025 [Mycoplasmoides pneumoniae 19294]ALA31374.1 hypothetical protein F536_00505 [Mycoplasmoides pneumoniae 39443]ALA32084.1 hypothetical protein F533_00510 [Mycoplasmoides pneumoniae 51494]ALA32787.1 hypothetical protein F530_00510 [Mycoplasmoides pne
MLPIQQRISKTVKMGVNIWATRTWILTFVVVSPSLFEFPDSRKKEKFLWKEWLIAKKAVAIAQKTNSAQSTMFVIVNLLIKFLLLVNMLKLAWSVKIVCIKNLFGHVGQILK